MKDANQVSLYEKGLAVLKKVAGEDQLAQIDEQRALCGWREDIARSIEAADVEAQRLLNDASNYFTFSDIIPRTDKLYRDYRESSRIINGDVSALINDIEDDPHTKKGLVNIYEICQDLDIDPSSNCTTTAYRSDHLVLLGTGCGKIPEELIAILDPKIITIIVADWHDWVSSFFSQDWLQIWNRYCTDKKRRICAISSRDCSAIQSYLSINLLPALDHAFIYLSPVASPETKALLQVFSDDGLQRQLNYTGFIMDEYNMLYNSWKSLSSKPRVFTAPNIPVAPSSFIVCASGPSLDSSLSKLKKLSNEHIIIASASAFGSLRKAEVKVDVLCLLERGDFMIEQYTQLVKRYGSNQTRLLASVTTPAEIFDLFTNTMVYFRPALTPLSLFADNPNQILNYEGPQSVNTGVALAIAMGAKRVILCGADLGTRNLDKVRSRDAVGESPREFNIEVEANYGGKAYSNQYLLDGSAVLTQVSKHFACQGARFYNASDGILIAGWDTLLLEDLLIFQDSHLSCNELNLSDNPTERAIASSPLPTYRDNLYRWWDSRPTYNIERMKAMWRTSNPRFAIASTISSILKILDTTNEFFPIAALEIFQLLNINNTHKFEQVGPRIFRGYIIKLLVAAKRQTLVLKSNGIDASQFELRFREMLVRSLFEIRNEIFDLFDMLESSL